MGDRDLGEARYRAFLSYSHRDAAAAGRLHRRLEAWRIPRRLVGRETVRGPVPARLGPIFRDREELPAATDLSETVREALAQSGALIILCSPHAAASLWVAEEIRVFRELHPDRPILAAILDGDPPDCFPDLLRAMGDGHEPLATDLRRERDGERLGLLKLVAGITGLGLDDLVQRDASRRVRRVMAVTAGAVLIALAMAALAMFAVSARGEAERQRTEAERQRAAAEGHIEFMITDLRERLKGVGRIDIMQAVGRQALGYFRRQNLEALPPDALQQRARVLQAIGEDDLNRGEFPAALSAFQEAHRTTTRLLDDAPGDPARIFAQAQSEYWVGRVHDLRQDWRAAEQYYGRYAAAAQRLIAIDANNPTYMMEMGYGAENLCIARFGLRNGEAAEASCRQALAWFERAARRRPADQSIIADMATAYAWLADTYYIRSLWRDSLAARMREYRLREQLFRSDRASFDRLYRLASAERAVARSAYRSSDRRLNRSFLLNAYPRTERLIARDARNATWRLLRAKVSCDLLTQTRQSERPISDARLRRDIQSDRAAFTASGNPRVSEISECPPTSSPD